MNRQSGFVLPPTMMTYGAIGAAVIILGLAVTVRVQTSRLATAKAELATFVAQTKSAGEVQNARTKETETRHERIVKEKDDENLLAHANLAAASKRLRDARANRGYLPSPSPGATSPTLATFDRANLERAVSDFDGEVSGIIVEGDEARINLDTAKKWAQEIRR